VLKRLACYDKKAIDDDEKAIALGKRAAWISVPRSTKCRVNRSPEIAGHHRHDPNGGGALGEQPPRQDRAVVAGDAHRGGVVVGEGHLVRDLVARGRSNVLDRHGTAGQRRRRPEGSSLGGIPKTVADVKKPVAHDKTVFTDDTDRDAGYARLRDTSSRSIRFAW
jgi:hypothetical protein